MADNVSKAVRSRMMSRIRGADTKPELILRKALHARGFRYRVNVRALPGSPDIVLPKWDAAIQVHGCYWHRHEGCPKATTPSSNADFWNEKFAANVERDARKLEELRALGWRTAIVWECAIGPGFGEGIAERVEAFILDRAASHREFS